jgi:signal transduction histidine kinase
VGGTRFVPQRLGDGGQATDDVQQPEVKLEELRLEVAELRASRARLLAAADAERRRIERDLHDGAQQHLVAISVNLQLTRQLVETDPAAAKALLDEIGRDVREALENVRELASAVYPPLLAYRGLGEALEAAASIAVIPTRVEASGLARNSPEVEAAVYFCCVEALENVATHAGAGVHATVRVWSDDRSLFFEVVDDGVGLEADAASRRPGLANIEDRLGALGGELTVSCTADRGTRVLGRIPVAE